MSGIENSEVEGQRIGDMDRDGLLRVIGMLADQLQQANASHHRTLDAWEMVARARR